MAEPTPASGVKPLTEAEQKTLDELNSRATAAAQAKANEEREAKLASYASIDKLLKLVRTDKVTTAIDEVMADPALDFDTKSKVQGFRAALDYNLGSIAETMAQLSTPAPTTIRA